MIENDRIMLPFEGNASKLCDQRFLAFVSLDLDP